MQDDIRRVGRLSLYSKSSAVMYAATPGVFAASMMTTERSVAPDLPRTLNIQGLHLRTVVFSLLEN